MTDNKMSKHKAAAEIIDTHRSIWCADGEGLVCLCDDWGVEVHDGPDDPRPDSIGALAAHAEHVLSALADAGYQVTRLPEAIAEVKVQIYTTRLRKEWTDKVLNEYGTISRIADVAEVDVSTISRWFNGKTEASERCIGTVLSRFPTDFEEAFVVTIEDVERRRARIVKRPTAVA